MGFSTGEILLVLLAILGAYLWRDLTAALEIEEVRDRSEPADARLKPAAAALARMAGRPIELRVAPAAAPNAFVTTGATVYVTRGLADLHASGAFDDRRLLAVLAHELAHLDLGHYARRRRRADVESVLGVVLRANPLGRVLMGGALTLTRAKLSREDEFEADARAARLLARIGGAPEDLADALETLAGDASAGGDGGWLASHPPTAARAGRLRGRNRALPA